MRRHLNPCDCLYHIILTKDIAWLLRCWTYETSVLLDTEIKDDLPFHDYFEYYGPDYKLHLPVSNMENLNKPDYLENVKQQLFEILR